MTPNVHTTVIGAIMCSLASFIALVTMVIMEKSANLFVENLCYEEEEFIIQSFHIK